MFHRCKPAAVGAIALGAGILLSFILPKGCVILICAIALIVLGITLLKKC